MKNLGSFLFVASLLLAGCNSNNNNTSKPVIPEDEQPLKAEDVASYVADFHTQQRDVRFEFNGVSSELVLNNPDPKNKKLTLEFEKGLVTLDFDFKKRVPVGGIAIELFPKETESTEVEGILSSEAVDAPEGETQQPNIKLVTLKGQTFNKDGVNYKFTGRFATQDGSAQYDLNMVFNRSIVTSGEAELTFRPNFGIAFIEGGVGTSTYVKIKKMINEMPEITTLVLLDISGSSDDRINAHTGRLIRSAGLTTIVPANGNIASGGVDLFLSGKNRVYYRGGKVGVHSWCCIDGKSADQAPRDAVQHTNLIQYSQEMLGKELGKEFYFFSIKAAPFTSIHNMTEQELLKYIVSEIKIPEVEVVEN